MRAAGIRLYAVSYDSHEALADFATAHGIEFPLLADPKSAIIRSFGILNTLVPVEEAEYYGMPFPGTYVTNASGVVTAKFFENNQIFRPAPEQLLRAALGESVPSAPPPKPVEEITVRAYLDGPVLVPGLLRELVVEFTVPEGQHLYGEPVPNGLVATTIEIESGDGLIIRETMYPPTRPHRLATGEELQIYDGVVELRTPLTVLGALGRGLDREESQLGVGQRVVRGTAHFQSCDDTSCGLPQASPFEVSITVEPAIIGDFGGPTLRGEDMNGRKHMRALLNRRNNPTPG